MSRKICVVTGTRAEFGLLRWLMEAINNHPKLKLQVVVTGMHLSPEFGVTYKEIEEAGFEIDAKVEMLLSSDTETAIAKSIGLGLIGFADVYERLASDFLVILGDRQKGRLKAQSVIDCKPKCESIVEALETLYSANFQARMATFVNPYGKGGSSDAIVEVLAEYPSANILKKQFYNFSFNDLA